MHNLWGLEAGDESVREKAAAAMARGDEGVEFKARFAMKKEMLCTG